MSTLEKKVSKEYEGATIREFLKGFRFGIYT